MAASGATPIVLFNSGTTGHTPTTANLVVGELAINYIDGNLFYNNGTIIKSFTPAMLAATSGTINGVTIGATTPSTGAFTALTASSTISGTGVTSLFAAPPAIGGTTAALITGTTVTANIQFTGPGTGLTGTAASLTAGNSNALSTGINYQANSFTTFGLPSLGSYNAVSGSGSSYYNAGFRNDANSFYLLFSSVQTSAANAAAASFNSLRPFSVALNTGAVSLDSTGAGINCGGNVNVSSNVTVTGTMSAGTVTQTSDENKKTNWDEPDSAMLVADLADMEKWGNFDWVDGGTSLGIGAQSLQKIAGLDAAIHQTSAGALSVNYGGAAMVSVIALAKELEELKKVIKKLRGKK